MKQLVILSLAAAVCTAVAAQPAPESVPKPDPDLRVVREVRALGEGDAPRLLQVQRGFFGISTLDMTRDLLDHFGVDTDGGVMVSSVSKDGPAERAGIQVGDILVEVDGEEIGSPWDTAIVIGRLEPGSEVYAKIYRNGRPQTLEVTVGESERGQLAVNWALAPHLKYSGAPGVYQYRFKTGPDDEDLVVFDTEAMRQAAEQLHERLKSPEFKARIEAFSERNSELEVRLQEMERRLEEMGERLAAALAELRELSAD